MGTWVRLLQPQQIEIAGKPTRFQAGDWAEVGKQLALRWIAQRLAEAPQSTLTEVERGHSGILVTDNSVAATIVLADMSRKISTEFGAPKLPWEKTLIWSGNCPLRFELVGVGFRLLDTWDVLYPLSSYSILAASIGEEWERERTEMVIRDLRVPVPDIRLIYVRRNSRTERLMDVWQDENVESHEPRLAFLRALYRVKPFQLPLPITWTGRGPR